MFGQAAQADDALDRVLERLDKLERENAKLKAKLSKIEDGGSGPVSPKPGRSGDDYHAPPGSAAAVPPSAPAIANSVSYEAPPIASNDGWYIHKKEGPNLTFQTPGG